MTDESTKEALETVAQNVAQDVSKDVAADEPVVKSHLEAFEDWTEAKIECAIKILKEKLLGIKS